MNETKIVTGVCRLSYVNVFSPKKNKDGTDGKYGMTLLIPKTDTKTINTVKGAIEAARLSSGHLFKDGKAPATLPSTLYDGDGASSSGEEFGEECKGHWVLRTYSSRKPVILDRNGQQLIDATRLYSGCYGRAEINFYAYNSAMNKGISAGLNAVQFIRDGEPFGGAGTTSLGAYEEEDDLGL